MSLNQFPRRSFTGSATLQTFTGNGSTTTFTLSQAHIQNETFVFVEDVPQVPGTDFTINGTILTFTVAPGNSAEIIVRGFGVPAPVTTVSDASVTTIKVADGAITHTKLHTTAIQDKLGYTPANETTVNSQITSALVNPVFTGQSITIPSGTTGQRPASPAIGMIRYNTTLGFLEQYAADGWQGIAPPPVISSVSPTTYNGEQGTLFTINGSNFDSTATVKFITAQGVEYSAAVVTRVSSSQMTATTAQDFTVANEPLKVKVVNGSGLTVTLDNAIDCGSSPAWTTASGTLATIYDKNGSYSPITTIQATDPDSGSTLTYSIDSGALPTGCTLNSSTGAISGDPNDITSSTTYNFTAKATDNAGNYTNRAFSIIVNPYPDGSTSFRAASSPSALRSIGTTTAGLYYIDCGNLGVQQVYCVFDTFNGGSISGQSAWALIARWSSYSYTSYNTYGYLASINSTTFGTRSQTGFWINPSVGGRGWLSTANSNSYVAYNDTTTGYYVTEATSGTFWQTSFIHTTSSGYPSNQMINVNYNSYNGSTQVGACWCESTGCTEHFDAGGNCSSTDIVRFDDHSGTSTVEIWIKG